MKKIKVLLLLLVFVSILSCKKGGNNYDDGSEETETYSEDETTDDYPDGTYCADIDYYNPDTGTRNTYTLNVEVEDHEVTVIHWPNGGWLDSSHFSPEELDSDGSCSIRTYDGKEYDIKITGSECDYTDDAKVRNDEDAVTCSECGGTKSEYDDYCYYCKRKFTCTECGGRKSKYDDVCSDCKDKAEHTCSRCGQHDSFMFSSDDLCSDCKRKQREEEELNNQ